jgi:hypothetical protein
MAPHIVANVDAGAAVLDGELVVWDNAKQCMAPFGLNKLVAGTESGAGEQING